ncbi:hypothetical protein B0T26DRAFT_644845 [Lasiosphaeria miniovina]|uniref:Uncharacterized protein n=1 Tax=Lasiosphaeria miniovina TaxID=1954250 RepID=A0AA40ALG4_9PEZI|nr:uncharacterized protein B0T26DRAFT_644845 [Lasiosphaeria miniovina]KAK0718033.1 hypothetical protein B0T26DRAFT_644845 [Lasiosphaeria miniovina]
MVPVAECLSQWKWNWFQRERPLIDFQTFDSASRGVMGSVLLMRLLRWNHLAVVGALVSVLGIVTSPMTQLLIQYPMRLVPAPSPGGASVPVVQHYRSRVGLIGSWSIDIANYVTGGLVHSAGSRIDEAVPTCPSGTCQWGQFQSFGICSRTANITDRLVVVQVPFSTADDWTVWDNTVDLNRLRLNGTLAYNVTFPDGDGFVTPVSYTVYSAPLTHSIAFSNDAALTTATLARYKVAWADAGNATYQESSNATSPDPWQFGAAEVVFYACVNTYNASVRDGAAMVTTSKSPSYSVVSSTLTNKTHGIVNINCTSPSLLSGGGGSMTSCTQDTRTPNQGVIALHGSGEPGVAFSNETFTADIRSLTILSKYILQDSSGIWAWDGADIFIMAGNNGVPTLADAVYDYMPDGGTSNAHNQRQRKAGDHALQLLRLQNVAENVAVSITNG